MQFFDSPRLALGFALSMLLAGCSKPAAPADQDPTSPEPTGSPSTAPDESDSDPSAIPATFDPPSYVDRDTFEEHEVIVNPGPWALPGTLSLPKSTVPTAAVVIVHGSGPNDRDGTYVSHKRYRDIAWGLASRGIAVLRYDKRTLVYGAKMTASLTVKEETADDAVAAAQLLRSNPAVDKDRIYILGHSLGGTMAPRILEMDRGLAGGILLGGAARPLEDILSEQQIQMTTSTPKAPRDGAEHRPEVQRLIAEVVEKANADRQRVKDLGPSDQGKSRPRLFGAAPDYWLYLRDYNPAAVAATLEVPLLVLQAGRDVQVPDVDYEIWKTELSAKANATFRRYETLNHLFVVDRGGGISEYGEPGNFVDQGVIDDIASWIHGAGSLLQ